MEQVLLVDRKEEYKALYGLGFYVYLGLEVTTLSEDQEIAEYIKKNKPSVIFINSKSFEEDLSQKILTETVLTGQESKVFILGETEIDQDRAIIFDTNTTFRSIIRSIAKTTGVTANSMASLCKDNFFPIPLSFILSGWQTSVDLFYQKGERYIRFLESNEVISQDSLKARTENGDEYIFVESANRLNFVNSLTTQIYNNLKDPNLSLAETAQAISTGQLMVIEQAKRIGITPEVLLLSDECINSMRKIVQKNKGFRELLKNILNNQDGFLFKHGLMTMYVGSEIILSMSWGSQDQIQKLAYVCFFHDLSLGKDEYARYKTTEQVIKDKSLDIKEKEKIFNHAASSALLISKCKGIPFGVDQIIKQHHGSKSGVGLENISPNISPVAIVFILAEELADYLITCNENKSTPEKQVFMQSMNDKYRQPSFQKILPAFAKLDI